MQEHKIKEHFCNKCGNLLYNNEGLVDPNISGGYFSILGDMVNVKFSLCEICLWKLFNEFKILPKFYNYENNKECKFPPYIIQKRTFEEAKQLLINLTSSTIYNSHDFEFHTFDLDNPGKHSSWYQSFVCKNCQIKVCLYGDSYYISPNEIKLDFANKNCLEIKSILEEDKENKKDLILLAKEAANEISLILNKKKYDKLQSFLQASGYDIEYLTRMDKEIN